MKTIQLISIIVILVVIVGFFAIVARNKTISSSLLQNIKIEIGMPRAEAEKLIADALKIESKYSEYEGSAFTGDQAAKYTDGIVTLQVVYNQGSPAPWVKNSEGVAEHYPPIDQTVKSFYFIRSESNFLLRFK